ncbi:hypothetical protein DVS28_b0230 (plasmid) [Euzebya pacifica]|uniref:Uncharacterized protein n=1 Tax=Euzebya pacifica TaxID=1608957 RepID=A0A346Y6A3_9ACTN|nr:hypothetical protein [Euzebya pacifica]AXV10000.1 hypothetical protein DVS28_b0230 [Euzebya pacifica]
MTATATEVLRARSGIASDVAMADGTIVEGVVRTEPDGSALTVTNWAKATTAVPEHEIVSISDTISGVTVWPVRSGPR